MAGTDVERRKQDRDEKAHRYIELMALHRMLWKLNEGQLKKVRRLIEDMRREETSLAGR